MIEIHFSNKNYPDLELDILTVPDGFSSTVQVFHEGIELQSELKGKKRYTVHTADNEYKIEVNVNPLEFNIVVNNKKIPLGKDVEWYDRALGTIPFLLVFGGILGATVAFISSMKIMFLIRYGDSSIKYLKVIGILSLIFSGYFLISIYFDEIAK